MIVLIILGVILMAPFAFILLYGTISDFIKHVKDCDLEQLIAYGICILFAIGMIIFTIGLCNL